ncbi:MAG: 4Fe-4S binding protein [Sphaerochaetaceae bacterium]
MVTVDNTRCVGCRTCELTCSFEKTKIFSPSLSYIRIYFNDDGSINSIVDKKCDTCLACIRNCPVGAIKKVV